jgi:hypothetical protein
MSVRFAVSLPVPVILAPGETCLWDAVRIRTLSGRELPADYDRGREVLHVSSMGGQSGGPSAQEANQQVKVTLRSLASHPTLTLLSLSSHSAFTLLSSFSHSRLTLVSLSSHSPRTVLSVSSHSPLTPLSPSSQFPLSLL